MQPEAEQVHRGLQSMAQALDGVAGALHEGHPVDPGDIESVAATARALWESGPEPDMFHDEDFEDARGELVRYAPTLAPADPSKARACGLVERAAHRMAQDLRWLAHVAQDEVGRKAMPRAAEAAASRLLTRYARFAAHPGAA